MAQGSGDAREDQAATTGAKVAAVYEALEVAWLAALAGYAFKVITGRLLGVLAVHRLAQVIQHSLAEATRQVQQVLRSEYQAVAVQVADLTARDLGRMRGSGLAAARLAAPPVASQPLAASLDQAAATAARSLQAILAGVASPQPGLGPYREADDFYRRSVQTAIESARGGMPGSSLSLSRIQAAQKALDDLTGHGITGFTDMAGRNWDLVSYVEMATRTAVSALWDDMQSSALTRSGFDLAEIYTHSTEGSCPLCRPWLGRTISLTGATSGYPSFADARATGWRHPNCRCAWTVLGAGLATEVTNPVPIEQAAAVYEASQRQRALERHVRVAGRRASVAITPAARTHARRQLAAARRASAEHRAATGLVMTKVGAQRREHPRHAH